MGAGGLRLPGRSSPSRSPTSSAATAPRSACCRWCSPRTRSTSSRPGRGRRRPGEPGGARRRQDVLVRVRRRDQAPPAQRPGRHRRDAGLRGRRSRPTRPSASGRARTPTSREPRDWDARGVRPRAPVRRRRWRCPSARPRSTLRGRRDGAGRRLRQRARDQAAAGAAPAGPGAGGGRRALDGRGGARGLGDRRRRLAVGPGRARVAGARWTRCSPTPCSTGCPTTTRCSPASMPRCGPAGGWWRSAAARATSSASTPRARRSPSAEPFARVPGRLGGALELRRARGHRARLSDAGFSDVRVWLEPHAGGPAGARGVPAHRLPWAPCGAAAGGAARPLRRRRGRALRPAARAGLRAPEHRWREHV